MTRVLVLGGTGFIGRHVVEAMLAGGHEVTVYSRGSPGRNPPAHARWVPAPADGPLMLRFESALLEPPPDVVIHMLAMGRDDSRAAAAAFSGRCGRFVIASSADVYLAYGRFMRLEPGEPEPVPLTECSPLRTTLFPYRSSAAGNDLLHGYEKILAEREILDAAGLSAAVARLPKVYGPGGNEDFQTVHEFADQPRWRWTHGYVENVAAAIATLALRPILPSRIYNLGERRTPTVAERLRHLPRRPAGTREHDFDFRQHLEIDSSRIRCELGFVEPVSYAEGIERTLRAAARSSP